MVTRCMEALRLAWCVLAALTFVAAARVWWPIRGAARALGPDADPALRAWSAAQSRAFGGFVVVASCNFAAGAYSYSVPVRPDVHRPPRTRTDWMPIVVPVLFVVSGIAKLVIVRTVWTAYRRVVAEDALARRRAAREEPHPLRRSGDRPAGGMAP